MDFFTSMEISGSGLAAERQRMNVAASNLANVDVMDNENGKKVPHRPLRVSLAARQVGATTPGAGAGPMSNVYGVAVTKIEAEQARPAGKGEKADTNGMVQPRVNALSEMVDMISASRAYEAGVTAMSTAVSMAERALTIGK